MKVTSIYGKFKLISWKTIQSPLRLVIVEIGFAVDELCEFFFFFFFGERGEEVYRFLIYLF